MSYKLGVDIGGTFTDLILYDSTTGTLSQTKTPTTPDHLSQGVTNGIEKILGEEALSSDAITTIIHGTTIATNAILEREGVSTGLITTAGFRDILQIGRQARPHLYDFWAEPPSPIVPRNLRLEVSEKTNPDGSIERPLDHSEVVAAAERLRDADVEAVSVCLLHAYANPEHEEQVADVLDRELDGVPVTLSSEILPEYREYERMSTTVVNSYVQPIMKAYLDSFERELEDLGVDVPLQIMQSNGGLMTAETAGQKSVHTLLSGPSAGVLAGQYISELTETPNVITFDMGGTSADICTIHDGEPEYSVDNEINDLPIRNRMLDINTIGAGGGSIGWIDKGEVLRVGPQSAGSQPGPVCYGRGGTEPTVTDAHLILGRLNPEHLLAGDLDIEYEAAERVMTKMIAEPLNLTVKEAAAGILDVVISNMIRGIRRVSVERGYDPRESHLVAFGGAGPLHAYRLIDELDMDGAMIPPTPGVASSLGLLTADTRHDYVRTVVEDLEAISADWLDDMYATLEAEAQDRLDAEGVTDASFRRLADMKFRRQGYELTVDVPDAVFAGDWTRLRTVFAEAHEREYGFALDDEPIEVVNIRLQAVSATDPPELRARERANEPVDMARTTTRTAVFDGETHETSVYQRDALDQGHAVPGPAIIEELSSTTVIGPSQHGVVDEFGIIHIGGDPSHD